MDFLLAQRILNSEEDCPMLAGSEYQGSQGLLQFLGQIGERWESTIFADVHSLMAGLTISELIEVYANLPEGTPAELEVLKAIRQQRHLDRPQLPKYPAGISFPHQPA
jgi:hypothetical protein